MSARHRHPDYNRQSRGRDQSDGIARVYPWLLGGGQDVDTSDGMNEEGRTMRQELDLHDEATCRAYAEHLAIQQSEYAAYRHNIEVDLNRLYGGEEFTGDILPIGTRIRFTTQYGGLPGTWHGTIVHRMVPNPNGFLALYGWTEADYHYEVSVFLVTSGADETVIVKPAMIERVWRVPPAE
jgi:hypothetical protein